MRRCVVSTAKRTGEPRPPRHRRRYSADFKTEAIRLVLERERRGLSLAAIGRDLGVGPGLLWQWAYAAPKPANGTDPTAGETLEEEVRRLRREVTVLRQEREFAKKAAAFFAKESL
jgi:transposase